MAASTSIHCRSGGEKARAQIEQEKVSRTNNRIWFLTVLFVAHEETDETTEETEHETKI